MAVLLLGVGLPAFSQGTQGTISGTILDQSGGSVGDATVTVTDVARGVTRTLVTDISGAYAATNLIAGTYTVRAQAKGFSVIERNNLLVEVGQTLRIDLELQPGEQTQTITVTEEAPTINTTDSVLGGTVSNTAINALPLNGRNFERLLQLRPGVVTTVGSGTGTSNTNGRRGTADQYRLEGIAGIAHTVGSSLLNNAYRGGDTSSLVPIDAIQEFSATQQPKAEYGFKDGSTVNVGIKSGTNSLHGTAYAFGRDAGVTDAANAFTKQVTPATMEQFGGTLGGRVIKDKLFWFAAAEFLRTKVGDTRVLKIPSDVQLTAVQDPTSQLSLVNACKALGPAKISDLSAQVAGLNKNTCVVSPASATVENLYPFNSDPTGVSDYSPGLSSDFPLNNGLFKGDYILSPNNHITGLFYQSKSTQYSATGLTHEWGTTATQYARQMSGGWTWTPSSTWVNDFKLGYVYIINNTIDPSDFRNPADPWPQGYGMNTGVTNPLYFGAPAIQITGFQTLGANVRTSRGGPQGDFNLLETVSTLRGQHSLKFGFEFVDIVFNLNVFTNAQGLASFSNLQNFLQGIPASGTFIYLGNPEGGFGGHWYSGFAQDDWRIKRNVTLNLGLRYEHYGATTESNNYLGNFVPDVNPATTPAVQPIGSPLLPTLFHPGWGRLSPRLGAAWDLRGDGKTVLRAGASILFNANNVGGLVPTVPFGANFPDIGVNNSGTDINAHTAARFAISCKTSSCPGLWNWNTTGATIFPSLSTQTVPGYSGLSCTAAVPCQTGGIDPNFRVGHPTALWNISLQRALTSTLSLEVAYVGNHGYHEQVMRDLNQPAIGSGWFNTANGVNAAANCIASRPTYTNCTPNKAAEAGQYTNTFRYLNNIDIFGTGAFSNYNGLQATLQGRNFHGLSFLSGYSYAHSLSVRDGDSNNNASVLVMDGNNLRLDYGSSGSDLRHRFTFSPTYNIPGMKAPAQMLEGWSLSGIFVVQSGLPWAPVDPTQTDWVGTGENGNSGIGAGTTQYWNFTGNRGDFKVTRDPIPCYGKFSGCTTTFANAPANIQTACINAAQAPYTGNAVLQELAIAALTNNGCYMRGTGILTPPAYGTIGNAGKGIFQQPGYRNVDLSLAKLWKMKERYSAQFRFEVFNLGNWTSLAAGGTGPTAGPGTFGISKSTPDSSNAVLGSGGPRHIQFGLKLAF